MNERRHQIALTHAELVALYLALSRQESGLDSIQADVLGRVATMLYSQLSVSEMEEIESYYRALADRQ